MATIWNYPTRIRFGVGEVRNAGNEAQRLGVERVLIVTDPGVRRAGLLEPLERALVQAGIECAVFDQVEANPSEANVEAAAAAFAAHRAGAVVGLGGGSPLDVAKLVVLRSRIALPFEVLDDSKGGDRFIPDQLPPVIAIPTTAGTGSEVGRSGVVTLASTGRKTVIFAPSLLPKVAILDPEMTRSMPASTTAATGFDALTHCLEALVATGDHPMADAIAEKGLELAWGYLLRAVRDGGDLDARGAMMKAAMMGAVAFQKGLGACHSLAHPLSSQHGLHHGLANALCLPAVVEYNLAAASPGYERAARLFGGKAASDLPRLLRELRAALGLPAGLRAVGLAEGQLDALAALAVEDACHQGNPRPCDQAALRALYRASL